MRIIQLKKRTGIEYKKFIRRNALETDYTDLVKEDCILVEDGKIRAIYMVIPGITDAIRPHLRNIRFDETTRVSGLKTRSRIFGYMPRIVMRSDYCRTASMAKDNPKATQALEELARKVSEYYKEFNPELYEKHQALTNKVLSDYVIPDTLFTSGIINENNYLNYHFDAGNFRHVASILVGVKENVGGGYLAMPEYDCALEIANDCICIFDGQDILHGVTPIELLHRDAKRYTIVYYSLAKMWNCEPLNDEIARIRQKKLERELKRAGIPIRNEESLGDNVK